VAKRLIGSGCCFGCEWGRLSRDRCIRWVSNGKGQFWGKCGASRCNQWGLCGMVILCLRDGDAALPKLLSDFLFTSLLIYFCENRPRLQDIMCRIGVGFIDRSVVI